MQTETHQVTAPGLEINPRNFLSLAVSALKYTVSKTTRRGSGSTSPAIISLDEISWHDNEKDCWLVIYDRVYDLTNFFDEHPGGKEVLLEYAGRDATIAFRGVGHSKAAIKSLDRFLIGELPTNEKIFRTTDGIQLSGIPF